MRSEDRHARLRRWSDDIEQQRKLRLESIQIKRGWDEEPDLLPQDDRWNILIALGFYMLLAGVFAFGLHLLGVL